MIFKNNLVLIFIPIVWGLVVFFKMKARPIAFRFPSRRIIPSRGSSWRLRLKELPFILRLFVLGLFIVALAGPRSVLEEGTRKTEGIDIVLAIDASGSMAGEDFEKDGHRVNRLAIVKDVVRGFIDQRPDDRIGLVAFGGLAYTVCPLTTDYTWLKANLERVNLGLIQDGTAVGSAILSSVARLKNSSAKSKGVILLTDGMNNAGEVDPLTAARTARSYGIKVYTIGAGSKGLVPFPARDIFGRKVYQQVEIDLDEDTLKEIASITQAQYFRATDTASLERIYKEINSLEKTKIEETGYKEYKEWFGWFLGTGLLILLIELILSRTVLMKIP